MTTMPFALVPDACRRELCGHPIAAHGDRTVVACNGDTSLIPGPDKPWKEPSCRCIGYTTREGTT